MRRDISALSRQVYDLLVVGGGIFGVCAAWDAALRGLSVALIERGDFANATSANSFKIVHGGVRYLQHADFVRIRESSRERSALLRIAPHLVQPLPILVPTYGHGIQGRGMLRAGLFLYDLLTLDRNRNLPDPERRIPPARFLSRDDVLARFPGVERRDLTGGALFHDAQMYNPPRLALGFVTSAVEAGAHAANYVEASGLLQSGDRITGVVARDTLSGESLDIRARVVLNAAGPWAERLLEQQAGIRLSPPSTYSRDACFIVSRPLLGGRCGLAVQGRTRDPDAIVSRKGRHLFIAPWRDCTLIGVWHVVHTGSPDDFTVTVQELESFLEEINAAYPPLGLRLEDVAAWNAGLVLFGRNEPGARDLRYGKRSRLVDHARDHGLEGLLTLIGVRYTTARGEAARAVELTFHKLGRKPPPCRTETTPIAGGGIESFHELAERAIRERPAAVDERVMRSLLHNHGSRYRDVLAHLNENPAWAAPLGGSHVIGAEVVHATRHEMAQCLADVVWRRTDLATGAPPPESALRACADLMAVELGWTPHRIEEELAEVRTAFALRAPSRWAGRRAHAPAREI
jgi:glycerol-3-phosphate dehydrogenase